eukprot:2518073-Pleurochrysis_carterae.AAC.1
MRACACGPCSRCSQKLRAMETHCEPVWMASVCRIGCFDSGNSAKAAGPERPTQQPGPKAVNSRVRERKGLVGEEKRSGNTIATGGGRDESMGARLIEKEGGEGGERG